MWKIKVSSVLSLVVNDEIHKDPNNMNKARRDFFQMLSQETAACSNMIIFRIHMDPPWPMKC